MSAPKLDVTVLASVTERHESYLEINFGSLQKGDQALIAGSRDGVGETLMALIEEMGPDDALIVWRR